MKSCENCYYFDDCHANSLCSRWKLSYPDLQSENDELKRELEVYKNAILIIIDKIINDFGYHLDEEWILDKSRKELSREEL